MRQAAVAGGLLALAIALPAAAQPFSPPTQCVSTVVAGGTADALTLPALSCGPTTTLTIVKILATNQTTTPTMKAVGGAALVIVEADGTALSAGEMTAGSSLLFTQNGTNWIKLTPGAIAIGPIPGGWTATSTIAKLSPQSYTGPAETASALSFLSTLQPPSSTNNFQITEWNQLIQGDIVGDFPWMTCETPFQSNALCGSSGNGHAGAPLVRSEGDFGMGDVLKLGGGSSWAFNVGQVLGWPLEGAIPTPTFINSAQNVASDSRGGSQIELMPDATGCCGPGAGTYRAGEIVGNVPTGAGTGYSRNDVITLAGGTPLDAANATVMTVGGAGNVLTAYISRGGVYTAPVSGTIGMTQLSVIHSDGTPSPGLGFTANVTFGDPTFPGLQGAIQYITYCSEGSCLQDHRFLGRNGAGSLGLIGQINNQGINSYGHLHISGTNAFDAANLLILDAKSTDNLGRIIYDGKDNSTHGQIAIIAAKANGGDPQTLVSSSATDFSMHFNAGAVVAEQTLEVFGNAGATPAGVLRTIFDTNGTDTSRVVFNGPDASTNGKGAFYSRRSDGSGEVLVLSTSGVGDVVVNSGALQAGVVTVAGSLGTCGAGTKGYTKIITDAAAAPVYNAVVSAGGTTVTPVFCNGTNWVNR